MAYSVRRQLEPVVYGLVNALNSLRVALVGSSFHADVTSLTAGPYRALTVSPNLLASANASDLPTTLTLCAEIALKHPLYIGDALAHKVADGVNALANAAPVDLATAIAFLNDAKAKFNAHIASTTYHYTADATNTIAAANATDLPTSITLVNAFKTASNAHIQSAPAGQGVALTAA